MLISSSYLTHPFKLLIKFKKLFITLSGSFWFAPLAMVMSAIVLGLKSEVFSNSTIVLLSILDFQDLETVRGVIGLIASSVISVISIAFSMTLVVLVMASNQFGPRIIRIFMESKKTQLILGLFTSTFVFSLIVYIKLNQTNLDRFLAQGHDSIFLGYPVMLALFLALICVVALIFFIHHVASSIQADNVVEKIAQIMLRDMRNLQSHHNANRKKLEKLEFTDDQLQYLKSDMLGKAKFSNELVFRSQKAGYVQAIEHSLVKEVASKYDGVIALDTRAGKYLLAGAKMATLFTNESDVDIPRNTYESFVELGSNRTPLQDPEYAVNQLVEIALRALSPSMDDPYTAINCIDKIACAIATFNQDNLPSNLLVNDKQEVRVVTNDESFADIFANAFTQIRQSAADRPDVLCHILETFKSLKEADPDALHLALPISIQATAIQELFALKTQLHSQYDLSSINARLSALDIKPIISK